MRKSEIVRKTKETDISLSLDIDGSGVYDIKTGVGFFDHMLELFTRHGRFDMTVRCDGDTWVDSHHTVEDVGIVMGQAFKEALGDKKGIKRYGEMLLPMDEALILVALDISGRNYLGYDVEFASMKVTDGSDEVKQMMAGSFDSELAEEFLMAVSRELGLTLHVKKLAGKNTHHIIEATFKACGRALRAAVEADARVTGVPSTKGSL